MMLLYHLFVWIYFLLIRVLAPFNQKAKLWVDGRKNLFARIQFEINKSNGAIIWMHCASLGEFEQGRPVLESIRKRFPNLRILLTFFSPSGYEIRKNYSGADMIFYMPMDFKHHADRFLNLVNPELAIFVKYESWMNFLNGLKSRNIPSLLISAIFTPEQSFFGPLGRFLRSMLERYSIIFVQDQASKALLEYYKVKTDIRISGDTRFDRVAPLSAEPFSHPVIEAFSTASKGRLIVAGSTWPDDIKSLASLFEKMDDLYLLIAPHEISSAGLAKTKSLFPNALLFSNADLESVQESRVLIIDTIGLLSKLYRFGNICFIGGGFNVAGIHNILEAATYGKPILFGPNHQRAAEAGELIRLGAAISFKQSDDLIDIVVHLMNDNSKINRMGATAFQYVQSKTGATKLILDYIENLVPLR